MHPHLPGNMTENHMTILELDPEGRVGEVLLYLALHFNHVFLRHLPYLAENPAPLKFAFFRRLSY